jgi:hypothetical protein
MIAAVGAWHSFLIYQAPPKPATPYTQTLCAILFMKIGDFEFTDKNHFVAMEYYWLILNRTFLILLMEDQLIGIKVHGPIGVESSDPLMGTCKTPIPILTRNSSIE